MKHKTGITLSIISLFILTFLGNASAATLEQSVSTAMKNLSVSKDDTNLLMMTNAPYVQADGSCALPYLAQAQALTGCTVGKGNLLFFQRPQCHPLRFMLFEKTKKQAVIISKKGKAWVDEKPDLSPATISKQAFWEDAKKFEAGKDMFTLAAMANVWAEGGPYDYLKSAELHNHICPGLTSGYLMAKYILKHYPLKDGEKYTIVACPVWCKEEAFQVVLDCTPGKRALIVKQLTEKDIEKISFPNPAAILLIWDGKKKAGKGVALAFDFERIRTLSPKDTPKAASVLAVLDHLDAPDHFVTTAAEFDLNETLFEQITHAGYNPYVVAGLVKK